MKHPVSPASETPALPRTVVLVGLMGAGKSAVGRRLAARLHLEFVDADKEIERAAACSIVDIFDRYGEPGFRDAERRVIARLLDRPVHILATGGGAFMNEGTRGVIAAKAISVWLRADLETLVGRTARRDNRPLLKGGNPRAILADLMERRYPIYALADLVIDSRDSSADETVDDVLAALHRYLAEHADRWRDDRNAGPG